MLRTIFAVGVLAILGVVVLKVVFGIFGGILGGLIAILIWAVMQAIKIALVGLVIYFILKLVAPDTARRIKERFSGNA